jgi:hypothetical protein
MQDISINLKNLHVKYRLFLSYFLATRIFSTDFRELLKHWNSWKAVQWAQLFHDDGTDGQIGIPNLTVRFRNFANAPENVWKQDNVFASVDRTLAYCWKKVPLFTINRYTLQLLYRSHHSLYHCKSITEKFNHIMSFPIWWWDITS